MITEWEHLTVSGGTPKPQSVLFEAGMLMLRGLVRCARTGASQRGLATPAPVSMRQVQV